MPNERPQQQDVIPANAGLDDDAHLRDLKELFNILRSLCQLAQRSSSILFRILLQRNGLQRDGDEIIEEGEIVL